MHHMTVKSNFIDTGPETTKFGFGANDLPLCPKPRRFVGSAMPEFLKPLRCGNHSLPNSDGRNGILNIIAEKGDGREAICNGSCYSGSPPARTENPLVHDVQFIHQKEHFSPLTRTKLSDKFGFTSATPI